MQESAPEWNPYMTTAGKIYVVSDDPQENNADPKA
jgi:hypothetical protein